MTRPIKKIDIINAALTRLTISGFVTSTPGPEEQATALERLEDMAEEFFGRNMNAGYIFEDTPDPNSDSGIARQYKNAFETNLASRLMSDYGKSSNDPAAAADINRQASQSLSNMAGRTALTRETFYSRRHPIGSGTTSRYSNKWIRYFRPQPQAPLQSTTNNMIIGEINDFVEKWDEYLRGTETIASFEIEASADLTIVSSSLSTPDVNFRVRVDAGADPFQQVKITVTTSTGRINTRLVDFNITDVDC